VKPGTPRHPKTQALAEQLGEQLATAVGILEMLWHFTAEVTPAGDIGKYTPRHIARHIGWSGRLVGDNLGDLAGVWPATAQTKEYPLTGYTPDGTDFTSSTGVDVQATGSNTNGATLAEILTVWIEVDYEGAPCDEGSNWFSMWD